MIGAPVFRAMSVEVSRVLAAKYSAANAKSEVSRAALLSCAACSRTPSKAVAHAIIATEAMAGVPSRLVQRLDVRQEPTKPSKAAAITAADGP